MKIIIVSKVINGVKPIPIGFEGDFTFLKGKLSGMLEKELTQNLLNEGIICDIEVDYTYDSCEELINEGADILLISPFVKSRVDVNNIEKQKIYFLSEEEFMNTNVNDIVKYIKKDKQL